MELFGKKEEMNEEKIEGIKIRIGPINFYLSNHDA